MAWFPDGANSKPLFVTIYGTIIAGILFSAFYVFSAIYSSDGGISLQSAPTQVEESSFPRHVEPSGQAYNFSQPKEASGVFEHLNGSMKSIWEVPKPGSKMPPLNTFRLTKELVQQRVKDNVVIITFGNFAFMDFILTWVKHLTDLSVENLIVGAMDTKLLEALYWKGVPVFDMGSHMSTMDVGWGSPTFHKMGREKNPLPYLARYPEADLLTSTDQVVPTVSDDSLDIWQQVGAAYNIGIFHWRPSNSSKNLAKEWKELLLSDDKIWDQNGFNELMRRQLGPSVDGDSGLVYAYDGSLKLGILPATIFCSGHTYFVQAMYHQLRLQPYAVHTTFQYAGTEGKRHRLREGMVFYDPPEYYDPPGGLLTFKPSIPKSLLLDGNHSIEAHFSLVNYQMKQIRTALYIASLLGRTLVMPPLWCRLDRLWFGHPGTLEGSMTRQPFLCPMDHVFEVHVMLSNMEESEFGPAINIREYSLFENPAMPPQVKDSWLDVHLCQEGSPGCQISKGSVERGILQFPKRSTDATFKRIFAPFKDVKKTEDKLRNRLKRYTGIWCCVENRTPGHIYYDMYWDEKPGWKPDTPATPEEDHPPW
ncbi:hypothetical protein Leryth_010505 [Lithospermum erythrorhizon]|nr:hypothetical protein Leryth_010505 [Lithospermum erythrorhizon]